MNCLFTKPKKYRVRVTIISLTPETTSNQMLKVPPVPPVCLGQFPIHSVHFLLSTCDVPGTGNAAANYISAPMEYRFRPQN